MVPMLAIPIQFLLSYASDLLKNAKKLTRATSSQRSAVDFLVLRGGTPLSSSIGDLRSKYLQQGAEKKDALRYYTRPLGLAEFGDFLKRTEILRTEVPRAQSRPSGGSCHADASFRSAFGATSRRDPKTGPIGEKRSVSPPLPPSTITSGAAARARFEPPNRSLGPKTTY